MSTRVIFSILAVVFFTTAVVEGCDDGCKPEDFRCNGSNLEICSSAGNWMQHTACADVYSPLINETWKCCTGADAGEPECLPKSECE